jgi:hypothetical protein
MVAESQPLPDARSQLEGDWPYIFTDTEFEAPIAARFNNIKAGFDRVRDREPRR